MSSNEERRGWAPSWVDALTDECSCSWLNFSDDSGWRLRQRDVDCIVHGDPRIQERL